MFRRFLLAVLFSFLLAPFLMGQELRVALPQGPIYAGEPLNVTLSVDGHQLTTARVTVSPEMPMRVSGSRMHSVNGRMSSSLILTAVPEQAGSYTITEVWARTSKGTELSSKQNHTFTVSTLQQDVDVQLSVEASSKVIYVGDRYTLTYTLKVPALKINGKWNSPFLQRSFFGEWTLTRPSVQIPLSDVQVVDQQISERVEGETYIYQCAYEIVAAQAGRLTFHGGVLPRQQRATSVENNRINFVDTYALGKPLEVEILLPPEDGRPLHWTGAIAKTFHVLARVDALNVVVGDPVKLTIDVLTDADEKMLRTMPLEDIPDFHFLADPERSLIEGGCRFVYTFRPLKDGLLELPELPFSFFDREQEVYKTVYTPIIPLRVTPMPKLYYTFGESGTLRLESNYPPPLRTTKSPQPKMTASSWAIGSLCGAMVLFVVVVFKRFWLRVLRLLTMPLCWCVPNIRVRLKLLAVRTPEEALGIVRQWTRRPALTPEELERIQMSQPAREVANAMRELEAARYASNTTQWKDAVKTLSRYLTKLKLSLAILFSIVGLTVEAMPTDYQWEEAQVITMRCEEMSDFRVATQHWLNLIHQGDLSKHVLLNAASTAFLAAEPKVSRCLVRHCEELYGRDNESEQMTDAIDLYQGRSETGIAPWLLSLHLKFPYNERLDGCVVLLAMLVVSFAINTKIKRVRRTLRCLRVILFLFLFLVGMSVWETIRWRASNEIPEKLPEVSTMEETQQ